MNVLVVLIPVSVFLGLLGLAAFVWTMRNAQYEDDKGSGHRVLDTRWDNTPRPRSQSGHIPGGADDP